MIQGCLGTIKGARDLTAEDLGRQKWISPHILKMKAAQAAATEA